MTERTRTIEDAMKDMKKAYGEESNIWKADDDILVKSEGISTGSHVLDEKISKVIWGIPRGRVVQFAGPPSSGKTLLSLCTIAQLHKSDPSAWALFIDAEFTFDKMWAKKLGVDIDRLLVLPENNGRIIFERLTGVPHKEAGKPKIKPGLLDLELNEPSGLGLIVIDSVAAIVPTVEEIAIVGKQNMAPLARFLPAELRRVTPLLSKTGITMIGINQIRIDPGVMYGNPERTTGGNALHHAQSLCINFAQIFKKDSLIFSEDNSEEPVGHRIRAKITKSKIAPGRDKVVEFDILYEKGVVNHHKEAVELGIGYGLVERPNNKTYIYNDEKFNGRAAIEEYFENDPAHVIKLVDAVKQMTEVQ